IINLELLHRAEIPMYKYKKVRCPGCYMSEILCKQLPLNDDITCEFCHQEAKANVRPIQAFGMDGLKWVRLRQKRGLKPVGLGVEVGRKWVCLDAETGEFRVLNWGSKQVCLGADAGAKMSVFGRSNGG
nr:hypothetical protein [Tanacetum cinerariifolium]